MINRSYLPYQSAREYIDRGMAKWAGFFISEHSSALCDEMKVCDIMKNLNFEEIKLLSAQVFVGRQNILLYTKNRKEPYFGVLWDINSQKIYLKTEDKILNFKFSEIININPDAER